MPVSNGSKNGTRSFRYGNKLVFFHKQASAHVIMKLTTHSCLFAFSNTQGYTPEEIETRCEIVDRNNAMMSRDSAKKYASQIVQSGAL